MLGPLITAPQQPDQRCGNAAHGASSGYNPEVSPALGRPAWRVDAARTGAPLCRRRVRLDGV